MRVPQVTERMKEAPAQALRAVFAGIGQVLLVADRIKNRPADGDNAPPAAAPQPAASPAANAEVAGSSPAAPAAAAPAAAAPAAAAPAADLPAAAAPAAGAEVAVGSPAAPAADLPAADLPAADLPVTGYDELSIASLRARMRSLDPGQLRALVDYERAHAGRDAVLAMFERRIAKVEAGEG